MEEKIYLLYNFCNNNDMTNCFEINNITLGKIVLDDIKITNENDCHELLNELDNEHFKENPLENIDDLFKNIKPRRIAKPKKEKKSQFEDDNSLFSERGTGILGQERRVLLSKIQQYKNLFPDELKKFKIKKNCSTHDLKLYLEEMAMFSIHGDVRSS